MSISMKVVNNFSNFVSELMLEKMKLKVTKFELILSKKLKDILLKMNHQIADDLMSLHRDPSLEQKFDRTFLDLGDNPGDISFIMANKIPELIEPEIVHGPWVRNKELPIEPEFLRDDENPDTMEFAPLGDFEYTELTKNPYISDYFHVPDLHEIQFTDKNHPVWSKNRVSQKASRVINTLMPNKYPANTKRGDRLEKPNDIETFQDQFTAMVEENSKKIVEVKGDKISYWYNSEHYLERKGTLGGSCMSDPSRANRYLKIYTENPDNVSLLVLFPEGRNDMIMGRAILWKLDEVDGEPVTDKYFMERIYTMNTSDEFLFQEYAKRKGYFYKSVQAYGTDYDIVTPDGNKKVQMSVYVNSNNGNGYSHYPYIDTLQYYCVKDGELTNRRNPDKKYGQCTDTGGGISGI